MEGFPQATNAASAAQTLNQIEFTVENVEKIVNEFYATSQVTNEFKPQLDQWLKQAQNSYEAWTFSWQLIDMTKSINCQFFGASCLYNKVSRYFNDVPTDQYDLLKNKLLEKLLLYSISLVKQEQHQQQQIRLIERKLNSTLAKLALYLIHDQWQNCISDIIQTIPNCINGLVDEAANPVEYENKKLQLTLIVVDLLTLLAEEYATLGGNNQNGSGGAGGGGGGVFINKLKRTQINSQLKKNFYLISNYLYDFFVKFNASSPETVTNTYLLNLIDNAIKCLTSWVEFGIQFDEMQQFIEYLFTFIYNDRLFEQSAECLTAVLSAEDNLKYTNTIYKYTPRVLDLRHLLNKYIDNKDTDGCVVLTKLILSFGENQLNTLFEGLLYGDQATKDILFQFLQLIMSLSSMPGHFPVDEESSDLTFVFWYTLQDTLLAMEQRANDLMVIFRPFFVNLLEIFIVKLKLPENYDEWSDEEKERLRCYRIDIGDTMVYMISLIGEIMLEFIVRRLVNTIEQADTGVKSAFNWQLQESLIYMLQSVVSDLNESCSPDMSYNNDVFLVSFINLLPRIDYSNKHILSTTLLAVGSLGSWLERNTHILPNAISLCLLGLKTESVTQSASFALKDIINDCDLSAYADQVLSTCQECLKLGTMAANYEVRLMSIMGLCLSDLLVIDMDRTLSWLQSIIEPYIIKLNELSLLKTVDKQTQSLTCHVLNLISQLMSSLIQRQQTHMNQLEESSSMNNTSLNVTSPLNITGTLNNSEKEIVNSILIKLIPIYKQIINRNLPTDLPIIDKLFESISVTLSSSISSTSTGGVDYMEFLLNDLIQMFYALNESSWRRFAYEVCRQILIIWWKNDKYKPLLENLFLYSNQTAMKLMLKDMAWFHDHTDVVEQYCTCLVKLLKSKYYDLFEKLNEERLTYLLRFAQLGLQLPEQYTLRAVATFLEEFVKFTKIKNSLIQFMENNSSTIIQIVLIGVSGALPRHLVDILSGILYVYIKEYPQLTNSILNQLLIKSDFQPFQTTINNANQQSVSQPVTSVLSKEAKAAFIKSLLSESSNKRKFKEITNEFSLTCRGLVNTQYGKETSNKY